MMRRTQFLFFVLIALAVAGDVQGAIPQADALGSVLILDQGRLKPLDTYARTMLQQFSGRTHLRGMSAVNWLGRVVFTPLEAQADKIFLINNPQIADAMGIAPEKGRRYSFDQLKSGYRLLCGLAQAAASKEARDRTLFENEALRTYGNLEDYLQLSSVLMFLVPAPEFSLADPGARAALGLTAQKGPLSYADIVAHAQNLAAALTALQAKDIARWTPTDWKLVSVSRELARWSQMKSDQPFHILPVLKNGAAVWQCPWVAAADLGSEIAGSAALASLRAMRTAFVDNDGPGFVKAVGSFTAAAGATAAVKDPGVELAYNRIDPFAKAKIVFGVAALLSLVLVTFGFRSWLAGVTAGLLAVGFSLQSIGIVARMLIMHRPPVTNMFETFVFVSWACCLLGFVVELFNRRALGHLIASVAGFFFLHLAGKYSLDEDTMGMLSAVLNSNFWLTTHIISITLGYAGCCCAGVIGHVYLVKKLFFGDSDEKLAQTASALNGILAFGLLFTVVGTMLGGMWADQAWGRFWGWDPKENGALLIVLWSAAVFHARAAKLIGQTGTAVGAVVGGILVMVAWIGVNLLGIGMHSYGFTSRGAAILYSFLVAEGVFLIAVAIGSLRSPRRKPAPRNPHRQTPATERPPRIQQ